MTASATPVQQRAPEQDTRFDRRFSEILAYAAEVFAEKGYEGASMRDLSRLSGMSLAGLYYYFDSKEKLLYHIQKHTFTTIVDRLRERLAESADPVERIRIFVHNHVDYAIANQRAMKVLAHEDDVLKNGHGAELASIKREYYRICVGLVEDLAQSKAHEAIGASGQGDLNAHRRHGAVRDDELAVHLVQAASRSQRRRDCATDERYLSARVARRGRLVCAASGR